MTSKRPTKYLTSKWFGKQSKSPGAASRYVEEGSKERHLQFEDLKIKRVQEAFSKARRGNDLFGIKDAG